MNTVRLTPLLFGLTVSVQLFSCSFGTLFTMVGSTWNQGAWFHTGVNQGWFNMVATLFPCQGQQVWTFAYFTSLP